MRKTQSGFTLIELMIVMAIIAIIAAIAIPGLLASQRASNERSGSASLKTVATAEVDFRANDRDGNKMQDFYTLDLSGLYGLLPVGSSEMIKLIDISVASADFAAEGTTATPASGPIAVMALGYYALPAPKAGYWYKAMTLDATGAAYQQVTGGVAGPGTALSTNAWYNNAKFGFCAFPESFAMGRNCYFLNEGNTLFKRPCNAPVKPASASAPIPVGTTGLIGSQVAEDWPVDAVLKSQYSKLD